MSAAAEASTDVAILGAGPTGLALACALAGGAYRVTLLDAADSGRLAGDPRALALSEGTRQLLERLSAWPAGAATPIRRIRVSQRGGPGETVLDADGEGLPALGHVLAYRDLVAALLGRVDNLQKNAAAAAPGAGNIDLRWHTHVVAAAPVDDLPIGHGRRLELSDGGTLLARLVVHAEGRIDEPPQDAFVTDYRQHAIVCTARPDVPHGQTAHERFTPDGPLALLPLGDAYAVVCVVVDAERDAMLALDDAGFAAELGRRLDGALRFSAVSPRRAFALRLRLRKQLHVGREVWIGNAAQILHPVSGQGFNLALRDAWTLADALLERGTPSALQERDLAAWARARQADRLGGAAFTDGIVRLFSNDFAPLVAARGLGLALLDRLPPAKRFVARRMIYGARAW